MYRLLQSDIGSQHKSEDGVADRCRDLRPFGLIVNLSRRRGFGERGVPRGRIHLSIDANLGHPVGPSI